MLIKVMGRFSLMEIKIINLDFLKIKYEEKQRIDSNSFSQINEDYYHFYKILSTIINENLLLHWLGP